MRRQMALCIAILMLGLLTAAVLAESDFRERVPLRLDAGAPISGRVPVQVGLPFAKGALTDPASLGLIDAGGVAHPLQTQVFSRWPDGSVKWTVLNFSANLRDGRGEVALPFGKGVGAAVSPLRVEESAEAIIVTTGPLRFRVSKKRFTVVDTAWYNADGDPEQFDADEAVLRDGEAAAIVVDETGKVFSTAQCPAAEYTAVVERAGPEHVVILCDGWHVAEDGSKFLRARVRLHADAGEPVIRIVYTAIAAEPPGSKRFACLSYEVPPRPYWFYHYELSKTAWDYIADWNLAIPLAEPARRALLGGVGEVQPPADLTQWSEFTYRARSKGKEIATGERAPGWADLAGERIGVTAAVRDFWQNYCKRLALDAHAIRVGLWPGDASPLEIAVGAAKTHEIVLRFHGAGESASEVEEGARRSLVQVIATAPPAYYAATGALGDFGPADPVRFPATEAALAQQTSAPLSQGLSGGIISYGDYGGANNEEDYTSANIVQYLRTGDPQILRDLAPIVRHYCDIDVRHWNTNKRIEGSALIHGHMTWSANVCHNYFDASLGYGLLTGDERIMEVVRKAGYAVIGGMETGEEKHGVRGRAGHDAVVHGELCSRDAGRMMILLSDLWGATGNPDYLEGVEREADFVRRVQNPDGAWFTFSPAWIDEKLGFARTPDPLNENVFNDTGPGINYVTLRGLMLYLQNTQALAGHEDQRRAIGEMFLRGVDGAINIGMNFDRSLFLYGNWGGNDLRFAQTRGHMWYNIRYGENTGTSAAMLPMLTFAAQLSGNEQYRRIADRVYAELLKRHAVSGPQYLAPYLADLAARNGSEPKEQAP